jgi:hypothetical protein
MGVGGVNLHHRGCRNGTPRAKIHEPPPKPYSMAMPSTSRASWWDRTASHLFGPVEVCRWFLRLNSGAVVSRAVVAFILKGVANAESHPL